MTDPVMCMGGQTFERNVVIAYRRDHNNACPCENNHENLLIKNERHIAQITTATTIKSWTSDLSFEELKDLENPPSLNFIKK